MTTFGGGALAGFGAFGSATRDLLISRGFSSSSSALRFRDALEAAEVVAAAVFAVFRDLSAVSFFTEVLGAALVAVSVSIFLGRPRAGVAFVVSLVSLVVDLEVALGAALVLGAEVVVFAVEVFVLGAAAFEELVAVEVDFFGGIVALECCKVEKGKGVGNGTKTRQSGSEKKVARQNVNNAAFRVNNPLT